LALTAPARGETAQEAIAGLNAQRAANGIPAGIVEEPEWSRQCELHMNYLKVNRTSGHDEDPSKPGYTAAGALGGSSSVLSSGSGWVNGANPWENAPIHLAQLLHPALLRTGASSGCMSTWRGYERPPPPETLVYTYPGPGRTGVSREQSTGERPFTPAELMGLRNPTGPHLYVFPFGGSVQQIASASLIGPAGAVAVRIADATTSDGTRTIGGYIPSGTAILIPPAPLAAEATYTATVAFASGLTHTWTFATPPDPNSVQIEFAPLRSGRRQIVIHSPAPVLQAWLIDSTGVRRDLAVTRRNERVLAGDIAATPGTWKACARSGGTGTGFVAAQNCQTLSISARWSVNVTKRGRRLTIRAHAYTRGRSASVSWQRGRYSCAGGHCRVRASGPIGRRTVRLAPTASVTLPAYVALPRSAVLVRVRIGPGRAYGRRVPALNLKQPYGF